MTMLPTPERHVNLAVLLGVFIVPVKQGMVKINLGYGYLK